MRLRCKLNVYLCIRSADGVALRFEMRGMSFHAKMRFRANRAEQRKK